VTPKPTQIFAFFIAFHIFVVGQRRDFKFGTQVGYIKSYQKNKKITPKMGVVMVS